MVGDFPSLTIDQEWGSHTCQSYADVWGLASVFFLGIYEEYKWYIVVRETEETVWFIKLFS